MLSLATIPSQASSRARRRVAWPPRPPLPSPATSPAVLSPVLHLCFCSSPPSSQALPPLAAMPSASPPKTWIDLIAIRQWEEERGPLPDLPQAGLSMVLLFPQFLAAFIFMPKFFICRCRSSPPGCRGVPHSVATELKLIFCCCLIICRNKVRPVLFLCLSCCLRLGLVDLKIE
jgi:hypothetical protein